MIQTAVRAAKAAGKILMENYGKDNKVSVKHDLSLVTNIDAACEEKIREIILKKYPDHSIVGEEGGDDNKEADYKWVIDPLDGTHNFIYNIPIFGVSIGLARNKEPIGGVIYLPPMKEVYSAEVGQGCFLNGKKLTIKDSHLKESLISISSCYFRLNSEEARAVTRKFLNSCFEMRVSGCAVYNLSGILTNRFGVLVSRSAKDWDVAAGVVMIREAGGVATDYQGNQWRLGSPSIVAGNKVSHKEALELLK
ncbi:inositol monophosphatase [Candidatus Woesearchaeota archaeon]|nr:inositol monophosphatase [Candidatus Woesearchaeota archaeon]